MIVADTNVVSELMRRDPDPAVLQWAQGLAPGDVAISVVTVQEVEHGIGRLPDGRRRDDLARRWRMILDTYSEAVMAYDAACAHETARVLVEAESSGRPMSLADAQLAGQCRAHGWTLATRNVRDFERVVGLSVTNPFDD